MLTAILHGKAGRTELDGQVVSWRDVFRKREDLLTSVFFSRLPYLSDEAQQSVLALLIGEALANEFGALIDLEFWPKLDGLPDRRYVEPDVILSFEHHLLVIEVKPPFGGEQSRKQWQSQIQALQVHNGESKAIVLLALGRNMPAWRAEAEALESDFEEIGLRVFCREWHDLKRGLEALEDMFDARDARILKDWLEAFLLFGMPEPVQPFSDLLALLPALSSPSESIAALHVWSPVAPRRKPKQKIIDWLPLLELAQALEQEKIVWV
nr:hypothetical protein [uncultured Pseudomonas sp.]